MDLKTGESMPDFVEFISERDVLIRQRVKYN